MEEMFCFQCQQTAHNTGCEGHTGVCGKKSDTANLQDELTGELIRLARAVTENERSRSSDELMLKGLFTTITNVNFNSDTAMKNWRRSSAKLDVIRTIRFSDTKVWVRWTQSSYGIPQWIRSIES